MPDLTPSIDLLRRLGLNVPNVGTAPSKEDMDINDMLARQQQANDPNWKKAARIGIGALVGAGKGLIGTDPSEDVKNRIINETATPDEKAEWYSSGAAQVGQGIADAGLPFAAYGRNVFHGSPRVFDKFDSSRNDAHDVLGWLTHFADDPSYAEGYASGIMKHGDRGAQPNILAAQPHTQNVLDLVNPNTDDLAQVVGSLSRNDPRRQDYIDVFKGARRDPENARSWLKGAHFNNETSKIPDNELPMRTLSEYLRLKPGDLEKTPFDAIHYNDMDKKSWAIPDHTPITTPWGVPLNDAPNKPLTVTRLPDDAPIKSELELSSDRWMHTPLSLPDVPNPESAKSSKNYFSDSGWGTKEIKPTTSKTDYTGWTVTSPHTGKIHSLTDYATMYETTPEDIVNAKKNFPDIWNGHDIVPPKSNSSSTDLFTPDDFYVKSYIGKTVTIGKGPDAFTTTISDNPGDLGGLTDYINQGKPIHVIEPPKGIGDDPIKTSTDYTTAQQNAILDEAEKLGFDYHHSNLSYPELEAKIKELKSNQPDVHDLGSMEEYEHTVNHPNYGAITEKDAQHLLNAGELSHSWYDNAFGTFAQKPWDANIK